MKSIIKRYNSQPESIKISVRFMVSFIVLILAQLTYGVSLWLFTAFIATVLTAIRTMYVRVR